MSMTPEDAKFYNIQNKKQAIAMLFAEIIVSAAVRKEMEAEIHAAFEKSDLKGIDELKGKYEALFESQKEVKDMVDSLMPEAVKVSMAEEMKAVLTTSDPEGFTCFDLKCKTLKMIQEKIKAIENGGGSKIENFLLNAKKNKGKAVEIQKLRDAEGTILSQSLTAGLSVDIVKKRIMVTSEEVLSDEPKHKRKSSFNIITKL